jgi:hypothetical protein
MAGTSPAMTIGWGRSLLPLNLRNRLLAAGVNDGELYAVAGMNAVEHVGRRVELLFHRTAAAGADGAALCLLDGDGATEPVDHADGAFRGLLRQRNRRHSHEHGARQYQLCQFHRNLPIFRSVCDKPERVDLFRDAAPRRIRADRKRQL